MNIQGNEGADKAAKSAAATEKTFKEEKFAHSAQDPINSKPHLNQKEKRSLHPEEET